MIDLHIHLLPGVDDGPESVDEALTMCRRAAEDGCTTLVATPHQRHEMWWNGDVVGLRGLCEDLQGRLDEEVDPAPRVLLGAEVRVGEGLLDALEAGPDGGVLQLGGSRYVLLELSRFVPEPDPAALVHELTIAGRRPIIAHAEEIGWLTDEPDLVEDLVARGATIQITGANLQGAAGRRVQKRARTLLDRGLVHFLASDAHNLDRRPPGLSEAAATVARRWGEEVAALLTETNPRAVVEDRPLPPPEEALKPSGEETAHSGA